MISERDFKMENAAPPSPALSNGEMFHGLPGNFNDEQHYGAAAPYSRDQFPMDPFQPQSQPVSRYSTPIPQTAIPYQQHGGMVGSHYPGYPQHMHPQETSPYGPLPDEMNVVPYSTPATSPPTPSRASDVMAPTSTTRGGAAAPRQTRMKTLAPKSSRIEKPAPKNKERAKAPKRTARLDRPMSELTKDSPIPVADIETYVNRSTDVRLREVAEGKVPGKIKRPMNAFMLYRKAYQNRAKDWCSQHNHQIVSQVCGDSWPLEPEHVRAQFNHWAKTERDNHQKAHPGYKFAPAKPQKAKSIQDKDADADDADDPDWDDGRSRFSRDSRSTTKTPATTTATTDSDMLPDDEHYQSPHSLYHSHPHLLHHHHHHPQHVVVSDAMAVAAGFPGGNRSAFHFNNPGKPMPAPYDPRDLPGHYYQTTQVRDPQRQFAHGAVEDLMMRRTPSPSTSFYQDHDDIKFDPMAPLPHGQHHGLAPPPPSSLGFDPRIDPSLLQSGGDGGDGGGEMPFDPAMTAGYMMDPSALDMQSEWQSGSFGMHPDSQFSSDMLSLGDPMHTQLLKGTDDSWHVEPLDANQFDNWVNTE